MTFTVVAAVGRYEPRLVGVRRLERANRTLRKRAVTCCCNTYCGHAIPRGAYGMLAFMHGPDPKGVDFYGNAATCRGGRCRVLNSAAQAAQVPGTGFQVAMCLEQIWRASAAAQACRES